MQWVKKHCSINRLMKQFIDEYFHKLIDWLINQSVVFTVRAPPCLVATLWCVCVCVHCVTWHACNSVPLNVAHTTIRLTKVASRCRTLPRTTESNPNVHKLLKGRERLTYTLPRRADRPWLPGSNSPRGCYPTPITELLDCSRRRVTANWYAPWRTADEPCISMT